MRKNRLPALIILFCFLTYAFIAYADGQSLAPVASTPISSNTSQSSDENSVFHLNAQEMEKTIKAEEIILRKLKVYHRKGEQKQHVQNTEKTYRKALSLYQQRRSIAAREALAKVENSIADYKSTVRISKLIDAHFFQKLRLEMYGVQQIKEMPLVDDLSSQAANLYQKTSCLGDDDTSLIILRKKMAAVAQVLNNLKQNKKESLKKLETQLYTQQKLDQIAQKADSLDQDVSQLAKTGNYNATGSKLLEFQNTMINELENLKKSLSASINEKPSSTSLTADQQKLLNDANYQRQADFIFRQGVVLYKKREYLEAKAIFLELASEGDGRAQAYLNKIERLIQKEGIEMRRHQLN